MVELVGHYLGNLRKVDIMNPEQSKQERFTYADYITWNDGIRRELIDGIAYIDLVEVFAPII